MSELSELVLKYYPNEKIEKDSKVELSSSLDTIFSKADFFGSSPLRIPMVETESMLFFDIRPIYYSHKPWLSRLNPVNIFISLIVITAFLIIFFNFILDFSRTSPIFIIFISIIGIPWLIIILRWNKTITNILAIKKSWITKDEQSEGSRQITWSLPENEIGFSFLHLLSADKKKNLSLLLKLQSGLYFQKLYKWLRKMSPVKFQDIVFTIKD